MLPVYHLGLVTYTVQDNCPPWSSGINMNRCVQPFPLVLFFSLFIRMIKTCIFCRPCVLKARMGKYGEPLVFIKLIQTIFQWCTHWTPAHISAWTPYTFDFLIKIYKQSTQIKLVLWEAKFVLQSAFAYIVCQICYFACMLKHREKPNRFFLFLR